MTFILLTVKKINVADTNADGKRDLADVKAGDKVLVQARITKDSAQPFAARKLIDQASDSTDAAETPEQPEPSSSDGPAGASRARVPDGARDRSTSGRAAPCWRCGSARGPQAAGPPSMLRSALARLAGRSSATSSSGSSPGSTPSTRVRAGGPAREPPRPLAAQHARRAPAQSEHAPDLAGARGHPHHHPSCLVVLALRGLVLLLLALAHRRPHRPRPPSAPHRGSARARRRRRRA